MEEILSTLMYISTCIKDTEASLTSSQRFLRKLKNNYHIYYINNSIQDISFLRFSGITTSKFPLPVPHLSLHDCPCVINPAHVA